MDLIIGFFVAFVGCIVFIKVMGDREIKKKEEERKNRKTSEILFNASVNEGQYTPEEVFETLDQEEVEPTTNK